MWWTTTSSRSSAIPVQINNANGPQTVTVNQLQNAGRWNSLGVYPFNAGTTYNITITSQPGPTSTCADAVSFRAATTTPLVADFSGNPLTGNLPLTVQFTDLSSGQATSWNWDFGDGSTSTLRNPSHVYNSAGNFTVSLTVSGPSGSDTKTKSQYINTTTTGSDAEHIYACSGYSKDAVFPDNVKYILQELGGTGSGDTWYYTNKKTKKSYVIHFVTTTDGFINALKQPNAHIVFNGHSNYGLGGVFAEADDVGRQEIDGIRYIDDDHFTHISTPMVSLKIDGMQYGQAYPNWHPEFKDGTSGIMPYSFSEGTPPYNYYLTYKVPGDPTLYKVELADGSYLQRFPDSGVPAWFSSSGLAPSPSKNPEYFIINNSTDYNHCDFVGTWPDKKTDDDSQEYYGYNYQYHAAGSGSNTATWTLVVRTAGNYQVSATWQSASTNASNARYTIEHNEGTATATADQRVKTAGYSLGTFYFSPGSYKVRLTDDANGTVVADSIRLTAVGGFASRITADNSYTYKAHFGSKTIIYGNTGINESELKYSRMFYGSCNSCNYYAGNFHRGILYCTTSDLDMLTAAIYIKYHLQGMSDEEMVPALNANQDIHEMINFNLKPPSLR